MVFPIRGGPLVTMHIAFTWHEYLRYLRIWSQNPSAVDLLSFEHKGRRLDNPCRRHRPCCKAALRIRASLEFPSPRRASRGRRRPRLRLTTP